MLDVLVRGGLVLDGTGAPPFRADVAVEGGRIVRVGNLEGVEAQRVVEADGLLVAPGFIDMHSHSDLALLLEPQAEIKLRQGVTLELVGQCGLGPAPVLPERAGRWRQYLSGVLGEACSVWKWRSFGDYLDRVDEARPAVNAAALVSYGAIRNEALGMENRPPTRAEIEHMKGLVDDSLAAGAFGMSVGLVYLPCVFAPKAELIELYRVVGRRGRFMAIHVRSQGAGLLESVQEALEVAWEAEVPLHVSHLCVMGRPNWPKLEPLLAIIDEARAQGRDVTFDQHPYNAGSTFLNQILPPWALEGGSDALVARLQDRAVRQRIAQEIAAGPRTAASGWENYVRMAGWDNLLITSVRTEASREAVGKTVSQLAELKSLDPLDVACDLLIAESGAVNMVILGLYNEESLAAILRHPAHTVGSDSMSTPGQPHPRLYGTFPRILGHYVRERNTVTLERAVHDMTAKAAARLGLTDRGLVREGLRADLVVFDPVRVIDKATYAQPRQYPEGIHHVVVNGRVALSAGQTSPQRQGMVLRA